jgi:hypothetical protein
MIGKRLRLMALGLAVAAVAFWLARGANRGWSKDRVAREQTDPVTGIVGISYENRFVPGVDFLGASLLASALLAGVSLAFRNKPNTN